MTKKDPANKEFILPIRVYYEDTDAGGVVYHSNYLNFMERARTEWLRHLGFEQDQLREREGVVFAVSGMEVAFLRPARFNDALQVSTRVVQFRKASLVCEQQVMRGDELLCRATVKVACIDINRFKPSAMPQGILSELNNAS
jgi:acyl-CoA thioester hydrolase